MVKNKILIYNTKKWKINNIEPDFITPGSYVKNIGTKINLCIGRFSEDFDLN